MVVQQPWHGFQVSHCLTVDGRLSAGEGSSPNGSTLSGVLSDEPVPHESHLFTEMGQDSMPVCHLTGMLNSIGEVSVSCPG